MIMSSIADLERGMVAGVKGIGAADAAVVEEGADLVRTGELGRSE